MRSAGMAAVEGTIVAKFKQLADASGRPFGTKNGFPHKRWFASFQERHKDSFRMRQANRRRYATRTNLDSFYQLLNAKMVELKLDASQCWNMDETGLDRRAKGALRFPRA